MQRRVVVVEQPDHVQVPVVVLLVVQAAHDVHLGRAGIDGLLAAGQDLLVAHHVATSLAQVGAEGTERAAVDANVGGIEVGVDVVEAAVAVLALADEVGQLTEFVQVNAFVPEHLGLDGIEPHAGFHLLADGVQ